MNKKGVIEGGTILVIMALVIFIAAIFGGLKIINILQDIPNPVWWIITAIVIYLIFKGKK